jgi:hypothetical protein
MLLHDSFREERRARDVLDGLLQTVVEQNDAPVGKLHRDATPGARARS